MLMGNCGGADFGLAKEFAKEGIGRLSFSVITIGRKQEKV